MKVGKFRVKPPLPNSQLAICEKVTSAVTLGDLKVYPKKRCPVCGGEVVIRRQYRGAGAQDGKVNLELVCRRLDCRWPGMHCVDGGIAKATAKDLMRKRRP
jgi:hypothetical protein